MQKNIQFFNLAIIFGLFLKNLADLRYVFINHILAILNIPHLFFQNLSDLCIVRKWIFLQVPSPGTIELILLLVYLALMAPLMSALPTFENGITIFKEKNYHILQIYTIYEKFKENEAIIQQNCNVIPFFSLNKFALKIR